MVRINHQVCFATTHNQDQHEMQTYFKNFRAFEWDFIITISTVTTTIISTMTTIIIPSSSMITSMICFPIVMLISKPEVVECKDKRYEIREQTRSVY